MAIQGAHMTQRQYRWRKVRNWLIRQRRRFVPYLVWYGDELDVHVTLKEQRLTASDLESAIVELQSGAFREIELKLAELGIEFDRGLGPDGRDWEWDWSLRGPISVRFCRKASQPHRRV